MWRSHICSCLILPGLYLLKPGRMSYVYLRFLLKYCQCVNKAAAFFIMFFLNKHVLDTAINNISAKSFHKFSDLFYGNTAFLISQILFSTASSNFLLHFQTDGHTPSKNNILYIVMHLPTTNLFCKH